MKIEHESDYRAAGSSVTRRGFVSRLAKAAALGALGAALASASACGVAATSSPQATQPPAAASPTAPPATQAPVQTPTQAPVQTPGQISTQTPTQAPVVGIQKAATYDRALVKQHLQTLLDGIGGVEGVAKGKKVAVKINMTGGVTTDKPGGPVAIESYITNPEVVRALLELLRDAGATATYVVEAAYEDASWSAWGYRDIVAGTSTQIVDLTVAPNGSDRNYVDVPTSSNYYNYPTLKFHPILTEIDSLVSVSKMKCHATAGVTHTLKNLFGLVPYRFYTLKSDDKYRSAFHGTDPGTRVPQTIIDVNSARRIDLSLVDGIMSAEGGEGPWVKGFKPVKAGLLIAGKDPVATDSVATACMGFSPTAAGHTSPFLNGLNHIAMAAKRGMGTDDLSRIQIVGEKIDAVKMSFAPSA